MQAAITRLLKYFLTIGLMLSASLVKAETTMDLSSQLNMLADSCATSDILKMIDLKESAPVHANDKLILTRSQDNIRKNFYKTSAVKDFNACKKSVAVSAKQLCEITLPFDESAYQESVEKYNKLKLTKKAPELKRAKIAARSQWKHHQNECDKFNQQQFASTEDTLELLQDDSNILVFSPTHKHKLAHAKIADSSAKE